MLTYNKTYGTAVKQQNTTTEHQIQKNIKKIKNKKLRERMIEQ